MEHSTLDLTAGATAFDREVCSFNIEVGGGDLELGGEFAWDGSRAILAVKQVN